ncbi:MAG TPA: hypothetical protein PLK99_05275, partial [Burkholderiales bacterium]|nr:hypothetical protein [Burkholderiales bacterium]
HFDYPDEEKLRNPSLFEEQIKRFAARSKDAIDELRFIEECVQDCKKEIAEAREEVKDLNGQIAEFEKRIAAENKKKNPDTGEIGKWRKEIGGIKESVKEIGDESAEWGKTESDCGKLKGEWEKELQSLRKIQEKLLEEWQKGSPWTCDMPTDEKPPGKCRNKRNYIGGQWVPCHLHR